MKVAFIFAGQFRRIESNIFNKSLFTLTKGLDYSIFSYCWEEMGSSLNHKKNIPEIYNVQNIDKEINNIFKNYNLIEHSSESYKSFKKNLPKEYANLINSKSFHNGTIHSIPHLYTLSKCYQLIKAHENNFDLIIKCRYDSIFIHPLKDFPLDMIYSSNCLYNLNFGRAYYPNRVYDIFFGGSSIAMSFLNDIWLDIPYLVNDNFDNGLDKRDICRIIYLSAKNKSIKVKSFKSRICDVFRNNNVNYGNYIISSHYISLLSNRSKLKFLRYLVNWFKENKISNYLLAIFIIKSILLLPLSYMKRIKYIRNFSL